MKSLDKGDLILDNMARAMQDAFEGVDPSQVSVGSEIRVWKYLITLLRRPLGKGPAICLGSNVTPPLKG